MKSLARSTQSSPEIIVDANITFSALLYPAGNERRLFTVAEAEVAKTTVRDLKDRPLFVFVHRQISLGKDCFLITGDKDLHTAEVNRRLCGRVYTAGEFLDKSGRS